MSMLAPPRPRSSRRVEGRSLLRPVVVRGVSASLRGRVSTCAVATPGRQGKARRAVTRNVLSDFADMFGMTSIPARIPLLRTEAENI
jgi:hypothetical protein